MFEYTAPCLNTPLHVRLNTPFSDERPVYAEKPLQPKRLGNHYAVLLTIHYFVSIEIIRFLFVEYATFA